MLQGRRVGSVGSLVCVLQFLAQLGGHLRVTGAGLVQLIHLCVLQVWLSWGVNYVCYRPRIGPIGSLVCFKGLPQLEITYVCYRRRVGSIGSLVCVLQAWLSWGHFRVLQAKVWLNWFTCVCVTGLAHLGVTYVCCRRRVGSAGSLVCVLQVWLIWGQ